MTLRWRYIISEKNTANSTASSKLSIFIRKELGKQIKAQYLFIHLRLKFRVCLLFILALRRITRELPNTLLYRVILLTKNKKYQFSLKNYIKLYNFKRFLLCYPTFMNDIIVFISITRCKLKIF